ncbi:hypothetical protein [Rhizobium oryzicola]|uniref:Uncharacterized protein n=1 Tax=Rhizobium oryzicola TaxID=1232668 RepID=A0ABT8T6S8_9HYPH|nr:hypothetical protein [Rhizobium oryzicola]MDO1585638.1 hypothetical protein [Rhizobium oryzicola]
MTQPGNSLSGTVQALGTWAAENAVQIDDAQPRWDTGTCPQHRRTD